MYEIIAADRLVYKEFCGDVEKIKFKFNPYNICVTNRIRVVKQHTSQLHMNNCMSSHVSPKVNDKFKDLMNSNYDNNGKVNSNRGKVHKYLGMNFDFTEKVKSKTNMNYYVERMINAFPTKISNSDTALNPYGKNIFEKVNRRRLGKKETEELHTSV